MTHLTPSDKEIWVFVLLVKQSSISSNITCSSNFIPCISEQKKILSWGNTGQNSKRNYCERFPVLSHFAFHNYAKRMQRLIFFLSKKINEDQKPNANSFYSQFIYVTPYSLPFVLQMLSLKGISSFTLCSNDKYDVFTFIWH